LVEELLTTYNYALETVTLRTCWDLTLRLRVRAMQERNKRVGYLLQSNQFLSRAAWPRVLEKCSRFPALMYNFVRKANLGALENQVQLVSAAAAAAVEEEANHVQPAMVEAQPAAQHPVNHI
jgi:hypothetical protein